MAEPQRASSLPAVPTRPRPRHASRHAAPPFPLDETHDLMSLVRAKKRPSMPAVDEGPQRAELEPGVILRRSVPRTPGEWVLIATLLLGLALNAGALLTNRALTGADLLLGSSVFFVGLALLVLMEICRRTERNRR